MLRRALALPAELIFTTIMVVIMLLLSLTHALPISVPSGERAAFVGVHYLYPLIGVGIWGLFAVFGLKRQLASTFLIALPCYALIMRVHFNIKLWVPTINPMNFDAFFWSTDEAMRPMVDFSFTAATWMNSALPLPANFYMVGFVALFYISFCYHALMTPERFRALFLSALIFQGLGALAYLPFPAIGPFLFEPGMDPSSSSAQASMLAAHQAKVVAGSAWIAANGGTHITTGLAAMPSLHTGGTFLFFLFACKYGRTLIPLYSIMLFYIMIVAVASRWHYIIDLPVGMALAWVSMRLGERLAGAPRPAIDADGGAPALQPA